MAPLRRMRPQSAVGVCCNWNIMDNHLPRHLAVIMDGNGRWAQRRGLPRSEGHTRGVNTVRSLLTRCRTLGIPYVTVYALSRENLKRPPQEVKFLFELFIRFLKSELPELERQGIRLGMIGDRQALPMTVRTALDYGIKKTSGGKMLFTLALAYSGREEIMRAARALTASGLDDSAPLEAQEKAFRKGLYNPELPDPDLIIRTSGELRLSNFFLFQSAYTEFYFSDKLWPDFDNAELDRALVHYAERSRRFGLTEAQAVTNDACTGHTNPAPSSPPDAPTMPDITS